ncbi:hypothetical protein [Oceanobacillus jeddahense]|uniref:DUF4345 domain-containing protein n=1 Tax=Oceanobacillus jeddahense TaxID=1462527 RepID=A0ABY5JYD0_9BACI|nr:hypothetical protein [Oceanobacillus jeddahense]UUI04810.1 hypothetical protein NP439_09300 [Oceanobacillus jeddahense]
MNKDRLLFIYLFIFLVMTLGAASWQILIPDIAEKYSSWNLSTGWQREIALWNIGVDLAIIVTLIKRNTEYAQILTFMATALCFLLGMNHFISALTYSSNTALHWLGAIEVLGIGTVFGLYALYKSKFFSKFQG